MPQYRTEVIIPDDRYVCLQLPASLPPGRATITIHVHEADEPDPSTAPELDPDREDIEWWDEFGDEGQPIG